MYCLSPFKYLNLISITWLCVSFAVKEFSPLYNSCSFCLCSSEIYLPFIFSLIFFLCSLVSSLPIFHSEVGAYCFICSLYSGFCHIFLDISDFNFLVSFVSFLLVNALDIL